ncbi:MAG: hypothetical protein EOP52_13815 [Sphingobacteriales bacterium]|nr:MAG: hypothetical protein EOP52_13815 [Sphingobacteriales bacterium]
MWNDHYLKFADDADFNAHMPKALLGESETHATDVVGVLYRNDTNAALEGYHVNLRLKNGTPLPAALETFEIAPPAYPKRVFM